MTKKRVNGNGNGKSNGKGWDVGAMDLVQYRQEGAAAGEEEDAHGEAVGSGERGDGAEQAGAVTGDAEDSSGGGGHDGVHGEQAGEEHS